MPKHTAPQPGGRTVIQDSREILQRVREHTDAILVAFSGGKDGLAVLDLVSSIFPRVECFHCYIIKDLQMVRQVFDLVQDKYEGIPIHQYPHPQLSTYLRDGVYNIHRNPNIPVLTWADIERKARRDTGIDWIANGMRMADSLQRRLLLRELDMDAINWKSRRVYPVTHWRKAHIKRYMERCNFRLPFTVEMQSFEWDIGPSQMAVLKNSFPDDYRRVKQLFPFIEMTAARGLLYNGSTEETA